MVITMAVWDGGRGENTGAGFIGIDSLILFGIGFSSRKKIRK